MVAKLTKLNKKQIEELVISSKSSLQFVLTVLAVSYLEKFGKKGVNVLIVRKANDWIKKETVSLGLD